MWPFKNTKAVTSFTVVYSFISELSELDNNPFQEIVLLSTFLCCSRSLQTPMTYSPICFSELIKLVGSISKL